MLATRLRSRSVTRLVAITSRARLGACRSPDLPQRRLGCRVGWGAGLRETEHSGASSLPDTTGRGYWRIRPDQRTNSDAGADHLFETNSCAAGTTGQSRRGGRATRRALSTADGTGAGVPDASTSDAGLPVPPTPRPCGTAEHA